MNFKIILKDSLSLANLSTLLIPAAKEKHLSILHTSLGSHIIYVGCWQISN